MDLIKEYDPNVDWDKKQIVEVTLMQWEYFGHMYLQVSGNCRGLDVLTTADFETDSFEDNYKDFKLSYDEDSDYFYYVLHDENGDTLEGEAEADEMNSMIVSIRFVDYIPTKSQEDE